MDAPARDRLAVGLDVPDLQRAEVLVAALDGVPGWLKVGSELFTAGGPAAVALARREARVFLDLKFHDIPNTVASAVRSAAGLGVGMLTVHTAGGRDMLCAAREAAEEVLARNGGERPLIIGVTVLTSFAARDLQQIGVAADSIEDQVDRLVDLAVSSGLDGVVASPLEAARVRQRAGDALRIVTPGVRPRGFARQDQARTATPAEAVQAGADLIVVARPVVRAPDPAAAARRIVAEIEAEQSATGG
jgi:orotidine-5'-phosphate decarboxylase